MEHQSFICFEATSNQFHPSRLQANHVAEGRRHAKSIWREEATYRRVAGGEADIRTDRSAAGKDKTNEKNNQFYHLKWNDGYLCECIMLLRSFFLWKSKMCVCKPHKQHIHMQWGGGDSQSFGAHRDLTLPMLSVSAEYVHRARWLCLFHWLICSVHRLCCL